MLIWQYWGMARVTRAESKERTRQRLRAGAQRLFRERGYAATSLEQIAEAAEVTKGAIYGHFASKEDLMLSALEMTPASDYSTTLGDESRPLRERVAEFSRAVSAVQPGDEAEADTSSTPTMAVQDWAIGQAMLTGLQIYRRLAPGVVTPEVFERAFL